MGTWFRLPRELRAVVCGAAGFALAFLAFLAWDFERLYRGQDGSRIGGWIVLAAVIGLAVTVPALGVDDGLRRTYGSIDASITYKRALRTGELPTRIDPNVWRGWLRLSGVFGRMTQLLAQLIVVFVVVPSLTHRPAYHPVAALLLGLLATWWLVSSWRKGARITRLADEVERHAEATQMTSEDTEEEAWIRLPQTVRVVMGASLGFSLAFVIANLDRLYYGYHDSVLGLLVWAAFVGLVLAVRGWMAKTGDLFGSVEQYIAYCRALRTGELPAPIDPDAWRGWLSQSRRSNRVKLLRALLFVVLGVMPSLITQSAYWMTASLFGLLAMHNFVSWWQRRTQIRRLAAEVERHASRGSTEG